MYSYSTNTLLLSFTLFVKAIVSAAFYVCTFIRLLHNETEFWTWNENEHLLHKAETTVSISKQAMFNSYVTTESDYFYNTPLSIVLYSIALYSETKNCTKLSWL